MNKLRRKWLLFLRAAFRFCGGYHATEHKEVVHAQLVIAGREAAELRLHKLHSVARHRMTSRMLAQELEAKANLTHYQEAG